MRQLNKNELASVSAAATASTSDTSKLTCSSTVNGGTSIVTCQTSNNTTIQTVCTTSQGEVSVLAKIKSVFDGGAAASGSTTTCTQTTIDKNNVKEVIKLVELDGLGDSGDYYAGGDNDGGDDGDVGGGIGGGISRGDDDLYNDVC